MSETYGSDDLRVACLHEERRKKINGESLFLNSYDCWTRIHAAIRFNWFNPKIVISEKQIRKKLKDNKDLPLVKVFLKKFKDKDSDFCPVDYLDNKERYLETMKMWKSDFQNEYLERYPHLGLKYWPVGHKKISRHDKLFFFYNNFTMF